MKPPLHLYFSPCPNDTFIFDAMVHFKINTGGLYFEPHLFDIDELNQKAARAESDITKISFFAYPELCENYQLLDAGSALGFGCGPLLISKSEIAPEDLSKKKIAVPGKNTTANFLMGVAFPEAKNKTAVLFSKIEEAVLSGTFDAGVIIHENRFTYDQKGLKKIADLGELWEKKTGMPIPLGGIAVRRSLDDKLKIEIQNVIKRSVEFALTNPESSTDFVRKNALAMDSEIMQKHIHLYVNDFSVSLGDLGKKAIQTMFEKAFELHMIEKVPGDIFIRG